MILISRVKAHIDQTTMYRTILYTLSGLAVWSVVLAFIGAIDFNPLSMVLSLAIVLASAFAVDRLLAYIFSVYPNVESIFITALIVYFLITPSGSSQSFVLLALAGALAAASKYLIVWRGRHVFNPAAAGVFLTGLLGVGYASWWVATPWLLPFVLTGALLVIYKTRRSDMVKYYVGASIAVILIGAIVQERATVDLVLAIFLSYPVVFFAGFMLTEPLTLAPRRAQRNWIAVVVAVVAYAQFTIGPLSASPEFALLVGNLVSFIIARRHGVRLTLVGRRKLAGDQVEYRFKPARQMHFEAGQYLELHIPHARADARGVRRMFTIASSPDKQEIRIITRHPHESSTYKKTLMKLALGTDVRATGVWGDFVLPRDRAQKLLLIAGGVGVTPFLSQSKELHSERNVMLIYAVNSRKEMLELPPVIDRANVIVHEGAVDDTVLRRVAHNLSQYSVYVSGPPAMVDSVTDAASTLGAVDIKRDFFAGY